MFYIPMYMPFDKTALVLFVMTVLVSFVMATYVSFAMTTYDSCHLSLLRVLVMATLSFVTTV